MKIKRVLCFVFLLSGFYSAFAFAYFIQLKPADMKSYPNILIQSERDPNPYIRDFQVVLLPQRNFPNSSSQGILEIYDQTNRLAECAVDGILLSGSLKTGWNNMFENEYYMAMTNHFHRPLAGAKIFTFQVATNLLATSGFTLCGDDDVQVSYSFHLKDFSDDK
ncbi:MAG TPA: hypothetical protein VGO57_00700 [Verrucomicrobiae bacterium]|jgi:hypothetical protein